MKQTILTLILAFCATMATAQNAETGALQKRISTTTLREFGIKSQKTH